MDNSSNKEENTPSGYDILIIDDSRLIINLLSQLIISKGFTCKAANNFSRAMEELKKNKPKVIFLDVNMPDLNGYKFCQMLKSEEAYKGILVYFLTGMPQKQVQIKVLETKADGYLTKPFDIADFNDILEYINI